MDASIMAALSGIATAAVTGFCAVLGSYFASKSYKKKEEQAKAVKEAEKEAELKAELESIKHELSVAQDKLDEHNGYAKRFEEIAVAIGKIETKLEMLLKGAA